MSDLNVIREVRRRAQRLDESGDESAIGRFAAPLGDDDGIALARDDALEEYDEANASALFCVTDQSIGLDYDGDVIEVAGLDFGNWIKAGCPWFWNHQQYPYPIGSSIDPRTGEPAIFREKSRVLCRLWFDLEGDDVARLLWRKVRKKVVRSCSLAMIPLAARRIEKAESWNSPATGFLYERAIVSECSLCGVGANPGALLQDVPNSTRKALICKGGRCFSRWIPEPRPQTVPAALAAKFKRVEQLFRHNVGTQTPAPKVVPARVETKLRKVERRFPQGGNRLTFLARTGSVRGAICS